MRLKSVAVAVLLALVMTGEVRAAGWTESHFDANGKPVTIYTCAPSTAGAHPAIVMLHGLAPKGLGDEYHEQRCIDLAADGYFTEFIEYYSQTDVPALGETGKIRADFPIWLGEIDAGLDAMKQNPAIDGRRIGMLGFSMGAFLSLSTGALEPDKIAAIVEYYGGLSPLQSQQAADMPPVLILHGSDDKLVNVSQAHTLDDLLTSFHRPHEMHIYPGANHGFNYPGAGPWADPSAAADSWQRTVAFFDAHLKSAPTASAAK